MYESDEKERYFHIYHRSTKEGNERALLSKKLCQMKVHMKKHINEVIQFSSGFEHYFRIITSEPMTAKDALLLYKSMDSSEKLFCGDKSLRVYGDAAADDKIFIEFIALIIRNRIYNCLKDE